MDSQRSIFSSTGFASSRLLPVSHCCCGRCSFVSVGLQVQGEVVNPDTNHGSACDMRFEMEGVEAAPVNTWPEW